MAVTSQATLPMCFWFQCETSPMSQIDKYVSRNGDLSKEHPTTGQHSFALRSSTANKLPCCVRRSKELPFAYCKSCHQDNDAKRGNQHDASFRSGSKRGHSFLEHSSLRR